MLRTILPPRGQRELDTAGSANASARKIPSPVRKQRGDIARVRRATCWIRLDVRKRFITTKVMVSKRRKHDARREVTNNQRSIYGGGEGGGVKFQDTNRCDESGAPRGVYTPPREGYTRNRPGIVRGQKIGDARIHRGFAARCG